MRAFLIGEGVLLNRDDKQFQEYATVYNKMFGFYDENQYYSPTEAEAIEDAKKYAEEGVENTYAIVSNATLPDDFDFNEGYVEGEEYILDNVVYSVAKLGGKIVENFLKI